MTTTNPIRRRVLTVLVEREQSSRSELAALLADDPGVEADARHLEVSLHHNHLPKLDADQFVEYDPRSGDVVLWVDARTAHAELNGD